MKMKVTSKWIKENFNCISISYGSLQYLLRNKSPWYYTAGIYGWNYDAYIFPDKNIAICEGYRGMPENVRISVDKYDIIHKYDEKAKELQSNKLSYDDLDFELNKLINSFLNELMA